MKAGTSEGGFQLLVYPTLAKYVIEVDFDIDLIDLYFKLCGTNMLHKKQIIHKIYNEMTDRPETRIIYCQLNVLCSRV